VNKLSLKSAIITMSVVVAVSGGVCTGPSTAQARQFAAVASNGDPGDGSEAEPSGGGSGDPTDGEGGDPTDGNGWTALESGDKGRDVRIGGAGDPGDGEEIGITDGTGSCWWQHWLELIRRLPGGGRNFWRFEI
jgi:hypothetical protein